MMTFRIPHPTDRNGQFIRRSPIESSVLTIRVEMMPMEGWICNTDSSIIDHPIANPDILKYFFRLQRDSSCQTRDSFLLDAVQHQGMRGKMSPAWDESMHEEDTTKAIELRIIRHLDDGHFVDKNIYRERSGMTM